MSAAHSSSASPIARLPDELGLDHRHRALRIDSALGCQPGSAAVVLLGGHPLTVTARTSKGVRAREKAAKPMTGDEVGLLDQLGDEINCTRMDLATLGDRLDRLHMAHRQRVEEFRADETLLHDFDDWLIFHERDRSPGSLSRCPSSNAGP